MTNVFPFGSRADADLYGRTQQGIAGYRVVPAALRAPLPAAGRLTEG